MEHAQFNPDGTVAIPEDVRDALGLRFGDQVIFDREDGRVTLRKGEARQRPKWTRAEFAQRLAAARKHALPMDMTTDDYMALIREPVPVPDPNDLR